MLDKSNKILSDITVFMKYARHLPDKQRRETWEELVTRNKNMHLEKFPELAEDIEKHYKLVYDKKVLPSMRSLQFAGKAIKVAPNRLFNCAYLPIDAPEAFSEIMFLLLGGSGVGFSVQKHHVEKLPEIIKPFKGVVIKNGKKVERTKRFLIGDSIEGWADSVKVLINSYFKRGYPVRFDFDDIRPKGAELVTAGGKAPGPQPLKECLLKIKGVLDSKENGDKLTTLEVHDIVCYIADAVLAGGIRRSALISLFSADDFDMLSSKYNSWWEKNPQRGRANNSVVLMRHKIDEEKFNDVWNRIKISNAGEPGIFFSNDKEWGTNPCLTGESLITTSQGDYTILELVDLFADDELPELPDILTYNEETKELEWDEMMDGALTKEDTNIIKLELEDGTELKLTPDHKVFTENRGWIEAGQLTEEDILLKNENKGE